MSKSPISEQGVESGQKKRERSKEVQYDSG